MSTFATRDIPEPLLLCGFLCKKKETHQKRISAAEQTVSVEYIPRKSLCQLIYRDLEHVKGMTQGQYEATITKYPVIGQLYSLLKEFHGIVFSRKENKISWTHG